MTRKNRVQILTQKTSYAESRSELWSEHMIEIPYTKLHKESLIPTVSKELRVDNPGSDTWSGVLPFSLALGSC